MIENCIKLHYFTINENFANKLELCLLKSNNS